MGHSAFAGRVGRDADSALEAEQGGDVDDLAGWLRAIMSFAASCESWKTLVRFTCRTCCQGFERSVDGGVAVDGAGVVDEDVDAAKFLDDAAKEAFGTRGVAEVGLEGGGFSSGGGDGFGGLGGGAAVAVGGDGGPSLRERGGDGGAKASGGPGYEGHFMSRRKRSRIDWVGIGL